MDLKTLEKNFHVLAGAPGGILRLRELLLQLAVQGKLVSQADDDEPASALLARVAVEKKSAVAPGRSRKPKSAEPVSEKTAAFNIPKSWSWARLADVVIASDAGWSPNCHSRPAENGEWGVLKVSAVSWGDFKPEENKALPSEMTPREDFEVRAGDFLMSRANTESLVGRSVVVDATPAGLMMSDKHVRLYLSRAVESRYINIVNNSAHARTHYAVNSTGTSSSMKNLSRDSILSLPVPLPPLPEQKRIVAKVNELMALCDELEAKQQQAHQTRISLNNASLDRLLNASDAREFATHWQQICDNFDLLYDHPENVTALRQAILQLAVCGKLVRQSKQDEPANNLIERAERAYAELIRVGAVRKGRMLPPPDESGIPYEVPAGWSWAVLDSVATLVEYGTSRKASSSEGGVPILRMGNIQGGRVELDSLKYVPRDIKELPALFLRRGDLLFNRTNSYELVGKAGLFDAEDDKFTFASYLIRVRLSELVNPEYINFYFQTPVCRTTQIEPQITQQTNQANFNGTKLRLVWLPIPPQAEQRRIVSRVNELLALCDEIQSGLAASSMLQERFGTSMASAVVQA